MAEAVRHDKTARQLRMLSDALDSGRLGPVRRLVNTLAPAEIGNLLESLPPGKREVEWGLVDPEDDGEVLVHVGDDVRESLLADMDPDEIIAAVEDLDIDDLPTWSKTCPIRSSTKSSSRWTARTASAWNRCCPIPRTVPAA